REATLPAMNEFELIEHYFRGWRGSHPDLILGQGDDCLIWHPRRATVMSIDTAVEGRHFPAQSSGAQAAQRAFLPALSDLAAMGAEPAFFTLALTLPGPMDDAWLDAFARRLSELSEHYGLVLAGGDTTSGPCRVISLQMHGLVDAPLRRDGVQPDDDLWVSGFPGRAAAALPSVLNPAQASAPVDWVAAYWSPEPRIELGQRLVGLASAAIDVSDGLAADCGHLARASGLNLLIETSMLPQAPSFQGYPEDQVGSWILSGGDDYELAFTAAPGQRDAITALAAMLNLPLTRIGRAQTGDGQVLIRHNGEAHTLSKTGFQHF
ncbi:MAG: thiamine-phosphate kinase, partial [Saccharospirillum sp.]|uniref:thiamine-phosphate kinase n=1 Tax=Saccharospirillum sp. TaxID=2033801 RepID=UPI0034A0396D